MFPTWEVEEKIRVKPPMPPEIRSIVLGSKGELSLEFSENIKFPLGLIEQYEEDQKRKEMEQNGQPVGARRLSQDLFEFKIEGATSLKKKDISFGNIFIDRITDKRLDIKINFENPS